jgi:Asp/Glu/hydantoin racemase
MDGVGMATKDMWNRSPILLERFGEAARRLVEQGAEVIVCHGMSMSPLEYTAAELTEASGVPVVEGMGSAIALTEAWRRLGTPYSPVRYARR